MQNLGIALMMIFLATSCDRAAAHEIGRDPGDLARVAEVDDPDVCQDGDVCDPPPPNTCNSCCPGCPTCPSCPVCTVSIASTTLFEPGPEDIGAAVTLSAGLLGGSFVKTTNLIDENHARAHGIVSGYNSATRQISVMIAGNLTLSLGQWNSWTGSLIGLAPGADYYVDSIAGTITPIRPTRQGTYVARIGRATSIVTMHLNTPNVSPVLNP